MGILKKLTVAIGSRTMEYRIDDESGDVEFNIWRKRLTYAWHLRNDIMSFDTMDFAEHVCGYDEEEVIAVDVAPHRSWPKKYEEEFKNKGLNVKHLKHIAMIMYTYRLVRFVINYFISFFINLEGVRSSEMFDFDVNNV